MSPTRPIRRVAVLGAGVMGSGVAAHLANAGLEVLLLDRRPGALEPDEEAAGKTLDDRAVATRLSRRGLETARRARPAAFFTANTHRQVAVGNFEDDLQRLDGMDWVVEAVVERLDVKAELFSRVAPYLSERAVISSNTSGLSCEALSQALPAQLRTRFLVTHFFNPPRYLHLLELVPGPECDPSVVTSMTAFFERTLGKGVVIASDTPNFIANRIGVFGFLQTLDAMRESGFSVAEVDTLTGEVMGRPGSATFRTADLVGLDVLVHTARNMAERLEDDAFEPPPFVASMVERGWLGAKTGQGFYRKDKQDGRSVILMLDTDSLAYGPRPEVSFPSLREVARVADPAARLAALVEAGDGAGAFAWAHLSAVMEYAARCVPEISPSLLAVDRALRWGFGWALGPFELWDALGLDRCRARFEREGRALPPLVEELARAGAGSFYRRDGEALMVFDPPSRKLAPVPPRPRVLSLMACRSAGGLLASNDEASVLDIGQEVACLQFHSRMNTLGEGTGEMVEHALRIVEGGFRGLVVGNEAADFSAGANLGLLLRALEQGSSDGVAAMVARFQDLNQQLRFASRPVVVAPRGRTLGGGCEMLLHGAAVCAAAESYIGLVEVGAGLIPAGGGCKEMLRRLDESLPADVVDLDLLPFLQRLFGVLGLGRVSTSAAEARQLGFLRQADTVCMNADHVLHEARARVVALDEAGYSPPRPRENIRVMGEPGLAAVGVGLWNMVEARQIGPYDAQVGSRLARVLCGGAITGPARVSEAYLLELEREAFLELCGQEQTRKRMTHLLRTGKPLREG